MSVRFLQEKNTTELPVLLTLPCSLFMRVKIKIKLE